MQKCKHCGTVLLDYQIKSHRCKESDETFSQSSVPSIDVPQFSTPSFEYDNSTPSTENPSFSGGGGDFGGAGSSGDW